MNKNIKNIIVTIFVISIILTLFIIFENKDLFVDFGNKLMNYVNHSNDKDDTEHNNEQESENDDDFINNSNKPVISYSLLSGVINENKDVIITVNDQDDDLDYFSVLVYKNDSKISKLSQDKIFNKNNYTVTIDGAGVWKILTVAYDKKGNKSSGSKVNSEGWYYQEYTYINENISCSFENNNSFYIKKSEKFIFKLSCVSKIDFSDSTIENDDLIISNNKVISVIDIAKKSIKNGFYYEIKVEGLKEGKANISLRDKAVTNKFENGNVKVISHDINIDETPPTIKYSVVGGTYTSSKNVSITVNDNLSGIDYFNVKVIKNGEVITSLCKDKIKSNNYTVKLNGDGDWKILTLAYDKLGNVSTNSPITSDGWYYQNYIILSNLYQNSLYAKNGIEVRFGVQNDINLFEPNEKIPFWIKVKSKELDNKKATIKFKATTSGISFNEKVSEIVLDRQEDGLEHLYTGNFSASSNGVYKLTLAIDNFTLSFNVGIVPKNKRASNEFYWGTASYFERIWTWNSSYNIWSQEDDKSVSSIMKTADYMGFNIMRADLPWASIQSSANSSINFKYYDRIVKIITEDYDMKLNATVNNTAKFATTEIADKYKNNGINYPLTAYPPNMSYYKQFITEVAKRYAANESIIWEIWNEPDNCLSNGFFCGTASQYLEILKIASQALKKENPKSFVSTGGLALNIQTQTLNNHIPMLDYFKGYKSLFDSGLIDAYSLHVHGGFNQSNFFAPINKLISDAKIAGINGEVVHMTEAGVAKSDNNQAANLIAKMLYIRSHGYKMYLQFNFNDAGDLTDKSIYNNRLGPYDSAIAYTVLIGKLGQATFKKNISDNNNLYAARYYDKSKNQTIIPVYSLLNEGKNITIPAGSYVYDMYGNIMYGGKLNTSKTVKANLSPIYIVISGDKNISL